MKDQLKKNSSKVYSSQLESVKKVNVFYKEKIANRTSDKRNLQDSEPIKSSKKLGNQPERSTHINDKKDDQEKINKKKGKSLIKNERSRNEIILKSIVKSDANTVQGVLIEDIELGNGATASYNNKVKVHYTGTLKNGKIFDSSTTKPFSFRLGAGEVIRGWDIGIIGMKVNGKRRLTIPPEKAYGKSGAPPVIPPNSTLIFEITLLSC